MRTASNSLETLALRKQILQARSTLGRLRMQHQLQTLRGRLGWRQVGAEALQSLPVRSALLGIALQAIPHSRLARMLAMAGRILLVAKVGCLVAAVVRGNSSQALARRPGEVHAVIDL